MGRGREAASGRRKGRFAVEEESVRRGDALGGLIDVRMRMGLATDAARRARGMLLGGHARSGLLLAPCRDVHTMGMREPLDIAFIDEEGVVLEAHRAVGPMRRLRNRRAAAVAERRAACGEPWFARGDVVMLVGRRGEAL